MAEPGLEPARDLGHERARRERARAADVEVDARDHALRPQSGGVVADDRDRIRRLEQEQSLHDRVERLVVAPGGRVGLDEADVPEPLLLDPAPGDRAGRGRLIDPTAPTGPTTSASMRATWPGPVPRSSTRMPGSMPAARSRSRVAGPMAAAC